MQGVAKDTLVMGAVLTVIGLFIALVYVPQSNELSRLNEEIVSHKQDLRTDAKLASEVPALIRRVGELAKYRDIDGRLPKHPDVGEFFREMTANVAEEKLPKPDMQVESPVSEGIYQTVPIRIEMEGNYLALGRLLKRLDAMERLTLVEQLTVKAIPGKSTVKITLLVNIYHMPTDLKEPNEQEQPKQSGSAQVARAGDL